MQATKQLHMDHILPAGLQLDNAEQAFLLNKRKKGNKEEKRKLAQSTTYSKVWQLGQMDSKQCSRLEVHNSYFIIIESEEVRKDLMGTTVSMDF